MTEKTIVNWSGGSTLQTWKDGEWQILYAKDAAGREITLSLADHEAYRFAWAMSPAANDYFERMRAANSAVYELSYPEARADSLRQIAEQIDCDGGCEGCGPQKQERGEFCGFVAAEDLRKLAAALDLKAKVDAEGPTVPRPKCGG
jgi:hypothetical protein